MLLLRVLLCAMRDSAPTDAADTASITGNVPIIAHEAGCSFHFDGVDGETTTSDSSGNGHIITLTTADIDTAQTKFGGTSFHILSSASLYELDGSADFALVLVISPLIFGLFYRARAAPGISTTLATDNSYQRAYPVISNS